MTVASVSQGLSLGVRILEQLLLLPIFLAAWGVGVYGEWLVISAIAAYLWLLDLGVVTAGSNNLVKLVETGKHRDSLRLFQDISMSIWLLVAVSALAVLSFAIFIPLKSALHIKYLDRADSAFIFSCLMLSAIIIPPRDVLFAGLRARQSYHFGFMALAASAALRLGAIALAVKAFRAGPTQIAGAIAVWSAAEYVLLYLMLYFKPPRFQVFGQLPTIQTLRSIGREAVPYVIFPLGQALALQGTVVVFGTALGPNLLVPFVVHRTLVRLITQIVSSGVVPLRNEAGALAARGEIETLYRLHNGLCRFTMYATAFLGLAILLIGAPFVKIWTRDAIQFDYSLAAMLLAGVIFESLWRSSAAVLLGTNQAGRLAKAYAIIISISLLCVLSASFYVKSYFAYLPVVLGELAMLLFVIAAMSSYFGKLKFDFVCDILRPTLFVKR